MEHIKQLIQTAQSLMGTLDIKSTRHNCDVTLGCMQILDKAVAELNVLAAQEAAKEADNDHNHP